MALLFLVFVLISTIWAIGVAGYCLIAPFIQGVRK